MLSFILPKTNTRVAELVTNDTLAYEFRKVISYAAGDDPETNTQFALLMEWTDGDTSTVTSYSIADTFNRYPEAPVAVRRRLSKEKNEQETVLSSFTKTLSSYGWEQKQQRRQLQQAGQVKATIWYLFGHSFYHINEAASIDGETFGNNMVTALQNTATWASFVATNSDGYIGITPTNLAASVDPASLVVSMPKLRYKPTAFGDLEGTALGSLLGVVVFVIAIIFIMVPSIVEKYRAKQAAAATSTKST